MLRRPTKAERVAAAAVIGMTVAVVTAGVKLMKRHTDYVLKKAAAHFGEEDEREVPEDDA